MTYRIDWVSTAASGLTTASWVEDDPQIPRRKRRPRLGVSLPTPEQTRAWALARDLPWEPPPDP